MTRLEHYNMVDMDKDYCDLWIFNQPALQSTSVVYKELINFKSISFTQQKELE